MSDKKETGCCKDFEDSACPCVDEKTGERDCGAKKPECCAPDAECCNPPQPCCE